LLPYGIDYLNEDEIKENPLNFSIEITNRWSFKVETTSLAFSNLMQKMPGFKATSVV